MNLINIFIIMLIILINFPTILWADTPADNPARVITPCGLPDDMNCFEDRKTAYAPEVNANFKAVYDRIQKFSSVITILENGNVGIGRSSPQSKLEVQGETRLHSKDGEYALSLRNLDNGGIWQFKLQGDGRTSNNFHLSNTNYDITAMTIRSNGCVGLGQVSPINPLEMKSGAFVSAGGVWTDASSREYKENISDLTYEEANTVLDKLKPVKFNYKVDKMDEYIGFIAEDVPDLVASKNRKGLSSMDIVAVLTKVLQAQQDKIKELESLIKNK